MEKFPQLSFLRVLIMIGQISQWNQKICIKIERISPRAIKKVDGHPPKSWPQCWQFWTLDDCNVSCWADGTSPIMDFDSWALGLSSPMKNKKKFFDSCGKKCPFSKFCMLRWLKIIRDWKLVVYDTYDSIELCKIRLKTKNFLDMWRGHVSKYLLFIKVVARILVLHPSMQLMQFPKVH